MSDFAQALLEFEAKLRSILDSESAPIMGPCLESIRSQSPEILQDPILKAIRRNLSAGSHSVLGIVNFLRRLPTVTVLMITEKISEAYGEENEYAVHHAIAELLGQKVDQSLSNSERKLVWREFRQACNRLGLVLNSRENGVGYMVEEFLHQAGLPLSFVPKVTELMLKTASEVGLPDEDDPVGISRWQECLLDHMKYLPPTAKKSIKADQTGFYIRTFLRTYVSPRTARQGSIAGIMAGVVEQSRNQGLVSGHTRALRIPRLLWRNDELLVELPPNDEDWSITVDGEVRTFRGSFLTEDVPILSSLPQMIEVRGAGFAQSHTLWPDKADNRFLIFDSEERLLCSSALGQTAITIPPGEYTFVLRFEPDGLNADVHPVNCDPDIYALPVALQPGQVFGLQRGPGRIDIEAETRPWIRFGGKSIETIEGDQVWSTDGSFVEVATGNISKSEEPSTRRYILRFSASNREIGTAVPNNNQTSIDPVSQSLAPGIHRIVVELCQEGTQRSVVRTAALFWKGFDRQDPDGRLLCREWPNNIVDVGCENATLHKDKKEICPRDRSKCSFFTEFVVAQTRSLILEWAIPGVFMQLDDYSSNPVEHFAISPGATLAAPSFSRQVLRVRSTEEGQIFLQGNFLKSIRSNHPLSLHVASLAEMLGSGTGELTFSAPTQHLRLLQLSAPHLVHAFEVVRTPHEYRFRLEFAAPCSAVTLHCDNMLSAESIELSLNCDNPRDLIDKAKGRFESDGDRDGLFSYLLTFESCNWKPGAWLLSIDVQIGQRWGSPTNTRQDYVALGLLIAQDGTSAPTLTQVPNAFSEPHNREDRLARFVRVHRALQTCYTPESWLTISWLKTLWKNWLFSYSDSAASDQTDLIGCVTIQPPNGSPKSWFPLQRVESSFPQLFCLPAKDYASLQNTSGSLANSLATMSMLDQPLHQFPAHIFCVHLACGFGLQRMFVGGAPSEFDFDEYCKALLSSPLQVSSFASWQPSPGGYLGRDHYHSAWERLRNRYRETLSGNDIRRQFAIPLCMQIRRDAPVPAVILQTRGRCHEPDSVEERFLEAIEIFVSSLAASCRRDVRHPGALSTYRDRLARSLPAHACSITDVFSYILQLAPDVFSFYLLLWEVILIGEFNIKDIKHA